MAAMQFLNYNQNVAYKFLLLGKDFPFTLILQRLTMLLAPRLLPLIAVFLLPNPTSALPAPQSSSSSSSPPPNAQGCRIYCTDKLYGKPRLQDCTILLSSIGAGDDANKRTFDEEQLRVDGGGGFPGLSNTLPAR